jgi:ribonuclease P protein component
LSLSPAEDLPKSQRIAKRRDFLRAYEQGVKLFGRFVVVFAMPNDLGHPRIGVTATRKIGKAHDRNRLKRWVREVYRRRRTPLGLDLAPFDFVVNLKGKAAEAVFSDFSRDLERALRRAHEDARKRSTEETTR